jgi:hypothetical protein
MAREELASGLLLQDFWVEGCADNFMMHILFERRAIP